MREFFTYGSVRGAARKGGPYPRLMAENQAAMPGIELNSLRLHLIRRDCCVVQFNPAANPATIYVVSSPGYAQANSWIYSKHGGVYSD
jgi:hypothetical protein